VADDNRDAAQSLVAMLQVMGHEVRETHDGIEALSVATTFRPNVMLLDIGMPRLDGYETARRVRSEPWGKDILLVATTGWGQEDDKRRASEAGFNHHLTKPIDVDVLAKLLPHAEAARRHGNPSSLTAASSPADC
jgi:CheY-like chemotaxis protein